MKIIIIYIVFAFSVTAQTDVTGIINTETTWTKKDSPYNLTGTVQIAYGTTLKIEPGTVIKGNGKREPFDRDKISKSIRIATRKRPIDSETIEKFISKIVRNLEGLGESEIPTPTIGKFIMEGLSALDKVAYVRFASVYKNFKEAKDFEEFVGNINENKS